jgi:hypothetical protein
MRNFGVTSPVSDRLWGTYDDPGVVVVPARMAPEWLLDHTGEVRSEYSEDYIVRSRSVVEVDQIERDRSDVFANVPPRI